MTDGSDVVYVTAEECEAHIAAALVELDAADWRDWAARCHLHCSDFPTPAARDALERLDTAAWLLRGGNYRDFGPVSGGG